MLRGRPPGTPPNSHLSNSSSSSSMNSTSVRSSLPPPPSPSQQQQNQQQQQQQQTNWECNNHYQQQYNNHRSHFNNNNTHNNNNNNTSSIMKSQPMNNVTTTERMLPHPILPHNSGSAPLQQQSPLPGPPPGINSQQPQQQIHSPVSSLSQQQQQQQQQQRTLNTFSPLHSQHQHHRSSQYQQQQSSPSLPANQNINNNNNSNNINNNNKNSFSKLYESFQNFGKLPPLPSQFTSSTNSHQPQSSTSFPSSTPLSQPSSHQRYPSSSPSSSPLFSRSIPHSSNARSRDIPPFPSRRETNEVKPKQNQQQLQKQPFNNTMQNVELRQPNSVSSSSSRKNTGSISSEFNSSLPQHHFGSQENSTRVNQSYTQNMRRTMNSSQLDHSPFYHNQKENLQMNHHPSSARMPSSQHGPVSSPTTIHGRNDTILPPSPRPITQPPNLSSNRQNTESSSSRKFNGPDFLKEKVDTSQLAARFFSFGNQLPPKLYSQSENQPILNSHQEQHQQNNIGQSQPSKLHSTHPDGFQSQYSQPRSNLPSEPSQHIDLTFDRPMQPRPVHAEPPSSGVMHPVPLVPSNSTSTPSSSSNSSPAPSLPISSKPPFRSDDIHPSQRIPEPVPTQKLQSRSTPKSKRGRKPGSKNVGGGPMRRGRRKTASQKVGVHPYPTRVAGVKKTTTKQDDSNINLEAETDEVDEKMEPLQSNNFVFNESGLDTLSETAVKLSESKQELRHQLGGKVSDEWTTDAVHRCFDSRFTKQGHIDMFECMCLNNGNQVSHKELNQELLRSQEMQEKELKHLGVKQKHNSNPEHSSQNEESQESESPSKDNDIHGNQRLARSKSESNSIEQLRQVLNGLAYEDILRRNFNINAIAPTSITLYGRYLDHRLGKCMEHMLHQPSKREVKHDFNHMNLDSSGLSDHSNSDDQNPHHQSSYRKNSNPLQQHQHTKRNRNQHHTIHSKNSHHTYNSGESSDGSSESNEQAPSASSGSSSSKRRRLSRRLRPRPKRRKSFNEVDNDNHSSAARKKGGSSSSASKRRKVSREIDLTFNVKYRETIDYNE